MHVIPSRDHFLEIDSHPQGVVLGQHDFFWDLEFHAIPSKKQEFHNTPRGFAKHPLIHLSLGIMTPGITIYWQLWLETSMANIPHWQQC